MKFQGRGEAEMLPIYADAQVYRFDCVPCQVVMVIIQAVMVTMEILYSGGELMELEFAARWGDEDGGHVVVVLETNEPGRIFAKLMRGYSKRSDYCEEPKSVGLFRDYVAAKKAAKPPAIPRPSVN